MLNSGGDNMLATLAESLGGAENGPVISLCATGGEEHPVRFGAQGGGNLMPGVPEGVSGVDAEIIKGTGIAPGFGHGTRYSFHRFGAGPCGGRVIKIDHCITSLYSKTKSSPSISP